MPAGQSVAGIRPESGLLVLGVDTCGPSGTVALARLERRTATILGQTELAGRSYSATLVAAVGALLAGHGARLAEVGAIVVVNGPGSFTGVRVGLSGVKGLAEPGQIPVVAVSRLAVLAGKSGTSSAALDAHRHEAFLRLPEPDGSFRDLLAGSEELVALHLRPARVAVCDEGAAALLTSAWNETELVQCGAPTALDAIQLCVPEIMGRKFADLALLDGHYLRRSDAEIFGDPTTAKATRMSDDSSVRIRSMVAADVDRIVELASALDDAPQWPRRVYEAVLDSSSSNRIVFVAEDSRTGAVVGFAVASMVLPEAELESIAVSKDFQRRGVARRLFAAIAGDLGRSQVAEVLLEVKQSNKAALGFYMSLGFVQEGRRPRYYADPVEDAVLMRLKISLN